MSGPAKGKSWETTVAGGLVLVLGMVLAYLRHLTNTLPAEEAATFAAYLPYIEGLVLVLGGAGIAITRVDWKSSEDTGAKKE